MWKAEAHTMKPHSGRTMNAQRGEQMPNKGPRVPSCPYHATASEKLAVKLIGGPIASVITDLERLRGMAKDTQTQQMLWLDTRAQYRLAVAGVQKWVDCPAILMPRPNRVE